MDRERLRQIARRLFDETERLFPGQLLWIAEAAAAEPETDRGRGGHVELGIARDGRADTGMAQAGGPLEPLVTIHLVARARNADHLPWRDEWEVTVISRPEEMVRFRPGGGGLPAGEWALWSMPLADGGIAVETRIEEPGSGSEPATNVPLVDITTVQQPGAPLLVATTRRGAQTIEVFQWVDVVAEKREGESPQSDGEASKEGA